MRLPLGKMIVTRCLYKLTRHKDTPLIFPPATDKGSIRTGMASLERAEDMSVFTSRAPLPLRANMASVFSFEKFISIANLRKTSTTISITDAKQVAKVDPSACGILKPIQFGIKMEAKRK